MNSKTEKCSITVKDVLQIAKAEIGYLEKASNASLDSKTANTGYRNYTKYGRDLVKWIGSPYANGVAWCDQFVHWTIITACMKKCKNNGEALHMAKKLLGGWSAYTPTSAEFYKKGKQWGKVPKAGAQVFFKNSTRICHTGLVIRVEKGFIHTIEGNTSSEFGVIANGGCVREKSYPLSYSRIAGYGYPGYISK